MIALETPKMFRKKRRSANVPEYLVYEIIDGKPCYYKGYRDVLAKTKTLEEITGRGVYLWVITEYLLRTLFAMPNKSKYHIATCRPVVHLDRYNNITGDVMLFDKRDLPSSSISFKYAAVPTLIHIGIDIAADTEDESDIIYLEKKTNKLLAFGTGKIIWIFTKSQRVLIATAANNWQWYNWTETLPLIDNVTFNIADYLKKEGIEVGE